MPTGPSGSGRLAALSAANRPEPESRGDGVAVRVLAWPAEANHDNPYHALLYRPMEGLGVTVLEYTPAALRSRQWDVLHLHWPEFLLGRHGLPRAAPRAAAFFVRLVRARAAGRRVVWTTHNLSPHDGQRGGRLVYRLVARLVDGVISHSEASLTAARDRYPALRRRPGAIVPHGHYRDVYRHTLTKTEARRSLGLGDDDRVLLFFGSIRPYKGVHRLLATFARTPGERLRLVVAGHPTPELRASLQATAAADVRVRLHLEFVAERDVERYFGAADLVVLPYDDGILDSGVALLGLSFDRPILVPDVPSQRELQRSIGPDWVRTFDELDPAALLGGLAAAAAAEDQRAPLDDLDWTVLAARTAALYRALAS